MFPRVTLLKHVQNNLWDFSNGDEFYCNIIQRHDEHPDLPTSIFPCVQPRSFDRTLLDSALKRINNNPNSPQLLMMFTFQYSCSSAVPVWLTRMNCLSLPLSSHSSHSSILCWDSENGAHSLSPCVASSLLYLLQFILPSRPSLPSAAAECEVVQVAHPLAPIDGFLRLTPRKCYKERLKAVASTGRRLPSRCSESIGRRKD